MNELFILVLGFAVTTLYWWAFKALPSEVWQFIGSVPERPSANCWSGINLTWYGSCSATAYTTGSDMFILLMGSVGMPLRGSLIAATVILCVCVPLSTLMVRWVEGPRYGFRLGGASFAGSCDAPARLQSLNSMVPAVGFELPIARTWRHCQSHIS